MTVMQISVFLENKSGRLLDVARHLGGAGVNIRALSVADTSDFGVVRLIVDDPEKAHNSLKADGFTVKKTPVVSVEVSDSPGGLAAVFEPLVSNGINVEYLYCFIVRSGENAVVIMRVEESERAAVVLQESGFRVLDGEELYSM